MRLRAATDGRVVGDGGAAPRHHIPPPHLPSPSLRHPQYNENGPSLRLGELAAILMNVSYEWCAGYCQ